jgi:dihydroorotase
MGVPLKDVIRMSTSNPAKEIKLEQLGHLGVGAPADVAVIRLEKGKFGYADPMGTRLDSSQRLTCEMTVRDGKMVYDLNGISRNLYDPKNPDARDGDPKWDGFARPAPPAGGRR